MQSRPLQAALAAAVIGVLLVAWAAVRAITTVPVAEAAPPQFATSVAMAKFEPPPPVDIATVVAGDLFAPERTAPARRYRLSGYATEAPAAQQPAPQPLVLGTSVAEGNPEGSFAIVKVATGPATVIRVGGKIGGYTVVSIERGVVVFTSPTGERVSLKAARP
jgi:hypothetical protein